MEYYFHSDHQRVAGAANNIIMTHTASTKPVLPALRGETIQGTWRLKEANLEAVDVANSIGVCYGFGVLRKWNPPTRLPIPWA